MGVVAPVSGVGAVLVPVVVGRPDRGTARAGRSGRHRAGVPGDLVRLPRAVRVRCGRGSAGFLDGVLAGLGFGTLFVALSRVSEDAGLLPLALNQAAGGVVIVAVAVALRQPWLPRERRAALG